MPHRQFQVFPADFSGNQGAGRTGVANTNNEWGRRFFRAINKKNDADRGRSYDQRFFLGVLAVVVVQFHGQSA
jgi:hypothetical protein